MWLAGGRGGGGVVSKKCCLLDLIDASYKLFPAIFFLYFAVFFIFYCFYSLARKKKLAAQRLENTAAGKNEPRNNFLLKGELRLKLLLTRTDLKPDWLLEVGALSASPRLMGAGFRTPRRSVCSCLATPYQT